MSALKKFFTQPNKKYRNFQIVFTILTLNFAIPAISYAVAPDIALGQFSELSVMLGGDPYLVAEAESRVWRYLAAANVMTLALMCLLLQLNLRKFRPVLLPLCFLKSYNAFLFLSDFIFTWDVIFLGVALFDLLTTAAFIYFARSAHKQIEGRPDDELVPQPFLA